MTRIGDYELGKTLGKGAFSKGTTYFLKDSEIWS
jgi:hypothetical protein